jgi:ketosteroid isomerase-like protein
VTTNADRAALLARALHAGVAGDRAEIGAVYTSDVTAWTPSFSASSLDELQSELERRDDAFSDIQLAVTSLDVAGDYACAEWRVTMSHTGDLAIGGEEPVAATGLEITLNGVTVAEFRGERICSFRQYWDRMSIVEQLGLLQDDA